MSDDVMVPPPRSLGTEPKQITITGGLIPWKDGHVVLLSVFGDVERRYLPIFSDMGAMDACLSRAGVVYDSIKQISDALEFLSEIPPDIVIIKDPYYTAEGKVRYQQVLR